MVQRVELQHEMSLSHIWIPDSGPCNAPGKEVEDDPSTWDPAPHGGDLGGAVDSWLWPVLALALVGFLGMKKKWMEDLSPSSVCLSIKTFPGWVCLLWWLGCYWRYPPLILKFLGSSPTSTPNWNVMLMCTPRSTGGGLKWLWEFWVLYQQSL